MARQVVLDTETTGLRVEDGHRLIEIGCLEMVDRKLTGKSFHYYLNPERDIEAGAQAVHGISTAFLQDKPLFRQIVDEFILFVAGSELIIHNATFDVGFINRELTLARAQWKDLNDHCAILDTLPLARQLHAGQRNSLDALCKRYGVDNSKRDMHGALLDAHLLAQVYLAMTGGQGSFFEEPAATPVVQADGTRSFTPIPLQKHQLTVIEATAEELSDHQSYLDALKKRGKCLWLDD
jgi:DNA polymerase-3 subunit epsilon